MSISLAFSSHYWFPVSLSYIVSCAQPGSLIWTELKVDNMLPTVIIESFETQVTSWSNQQPAFLTHPWHRQRCITSYRLNPRNGSLSFAPHQLEAWTVVILSLPWQLWEAMLVSLSWLLLLLKRAGLSVSTNRANQAVSWYWSIFPETTHSLMTPFTICYQNISVSNSDRCSLCTLMLMLCRSSAAMDSFVQQWTSMINWTQTSALLWQYGPCQTEHPSRWAHNKIFHDGNIWGSWFYRAKNWFRSWHDQRLWETVSFGFC